MFDFELFMNNVLNKAQGNSFENNVDLVLLLVMRDMRNYKYYINENKTDIGAFSPCFEVFAHILMNRDDLTKVESDRYCDACNEFLEKLQEDDLIYFDECVNVTCILEPVFTSPAHVFATIFCRCLR